MKVKIAISIGIGVTVIVVVAVVAIFIWKKLNGATNRDEEITLVNFDVNPASRIIESEPKSLSEEEREFDELLEAYQEARRSSLDIKPGTYFLKRRNLEHFLYSLKI